MLNANCTPAACVPWRSSCANSLRSCPWRRAGAGRLRAGLWIACSIRRASMRSAPASRKTCRAGCHRACSRSAAGRVALAVFKAKLVQRRSAAGAAGCSGPVPERRQLRCLRAAPRCTLPAPGHASRPRTSCGVSRRAPPHDLEGVAKAGCGPGVSRCGDSRPKVGKLASNAALRCSKTVTCGRRTVRWWTMPTMPVAHDGNFHEFECFRL